MRSRPAAHHHELGRAFRPGRWGYASRIPRSSRRRAPTRAPPRPAVQLFSHPKRAEPYPEPRSRRCGRAQRSRTRPVRGRQRTASHRCRPQGDPVPGTPAASRPSATPTSVP
ncbi:hypothetical protein ACFPRL_26000 [Pseudoclavibacter helvolus]